MRNQFLSANNSEGGNADQSTNDSIDTSLLKDDLYKAVNGRWEKTAKIPADHSSTGGFMDLNDNIDKQLMSDLDELENKNVDSFEAPFSDCLLYTSPSPRDTR